MDPLVSVIIPVYNVRSYLAAAIESVLAQNIDVTNLEIILVDDGSTDGSDELCQNYAGTYPQTIRLITQKNSGVSHARNVGLAAAKGKYVHFLDADDLLSKNFYAKAVDFLDRHTGEIDFVAAKIQFFDEIIDSHPLNYKFYDDRVIDLSREPDNPILHVASCVFLRSSIDDVRFDEQLGISEDVKFLSDVLLSKRKYGVVTSPTYYYRKRTSSVSAIGGSRRNRDFYLTVPERVYAYMLDQWTDKGDALEYTVLYDLSYRLDQKTQSVLSPEDERRYKDSIASIAARCSDAAILAHRFLSVYQKLYLLRIKHGKAADSHIKTRGSKMYFDEALLYDLQNSSLFVDFLTPGKNNRYVVEGYIDGLVDIEGISITADTVEGREKLKFVARQQREVSFLGDVYATGGAFEVEIPVPVTSHLKFTLRVADTDIVLPMATGPFTRFGALKLTYRRDEGRLLKRLPREIRSYRYSAVRHVALELRMLLQILLNWRVGTVRQRLHKLRTLNLAQLSLKGKVREIAKPWFFMAEAIFYIPRAFVLRIGYYIAKQFKKRPIWIISDRGMAAGDNGEALFRYIMSQPDCPADVYFVISKKSKSFNELQSIGKVLKQESLAYKLKFLLSDKIIASQADVETTNPFIRQQDHYIDLFQFDFVFLQHGIIRHDLSAWLNRFNKNVGLFITSAQKEYDSIFGNPYYYRKSDVLLSGLARYDYLENEPDGTLILAPTYRKNLIAHQRTDRIGRRHYDPSFKNSEYRQFYNNLINDKRILEALRTHNMKGEFYLHPAFSEQRQDFDENDHFKMMQFPYDYKAAFRKGDMLISDYSSVVFDFVYLKKPVAYAHFDVDTFFEGHSYVRSSFFNDADDGFGEVYYDYDTLVEGIVRTINAGCAMPDKYKKRVDDFFYKIDKNNSKRIYDAIIKMDT